MLWKHLALDVTDLTFKHSYMSYNKQILKTSLDQITKETFKEAVFLCYKDGITSKAPLGWSGDSIVLFGTEEDGRKSLVSIRNYCGNAELLITDMDGYFLFYGRFSIDLGIEFVVDQYWQIFNLVKDKIETIVERKGFDYLVKYDNGKTNDFMQFLKEDSY